MELGNIEDLSKAYVIRAEPPARGASTKLQFIEGTDRHGNKFIQFLRDGVPEHKIRIFLNEWLEILDKKPFAKPKKAAKQVKVTVTDTITEEEFNKPVAE